MKSLNVGLLSIVMAYSALNGCGGDRADNINPQPPATPMTIKAVTNDNADVVLSWPAVSGADSYNIYYSTDPKLDIKNYAVYANSGWIKNITSSYLVKGLNIAPIYFFIITANSKGLESSPSELVSVVTRYEIVGKNGDVVRDKVTNLEWQRCSLGQTWSNTQNACIGSATTYGTAQTITFITPNHDGWRLPSREELSSLRFCNFEGSEQIDYFPKYLQSCDKSTFPLIVESFFPKTQTIRPYNALPENYMIDSSKTIFAYYAVPFGSIISYGCSEDGTGGVSLCRPNYIRLVRG